MIYIWSLEKHLVTSPDFDTEEFPSGIYHRDKDLSKH